MPTVELIYDADLKEDIVFRNAWVPNYVARRTGTRWFLSNKAGGWLIVDDDVYEQLRSVAIPLSLYRTAERHHLILTAANAKSYFDAYQVWATPHFRHPTHHIIVSTLRCNLSCSYCHAAVVPANAGKQYDLSVETAEAILEFALNSKAPVQSFEFQGGESLLNGAVLKHLIPRIAAEYTAARREVYFSVQTNATMLTDEWMSFFRVHGVRVGTSVDGPQEVHDLQRVRNDGGGTYERVAGAVEKYKLGTLPTVTRQMLPLWKSIIDQQLNQGTTVVSFHKVYPINSAKANWEEVGIGYKEYLDCYSHVLSYLRSLWSENYYPIERRAYFALRKLYARRDVDFSDFGNPCGMIHSQIVYHTNGDVYTCDEGRDFDDFRLGNVRTDSYDQIVFGAKARALKSLSMPNDEECHTCAFRTVCSTCPVYDRATTGHLTARHAGTDKCAETMSIFDMVVSWVAEDAGLLQRFAHHYGWDANASH